MYLFKADMEVRQRQQQMITLLIKGLEEKLMDTLKAKAEEAGAVRKGQREMQMDTLKAGMEAQSKATAADDYFLETLRAKANSAA